MTSSGSSVTARNMSYNGTVAAGASTSFGFLGSWNGTNSVPGGVLPSVTAGSHLITLKKSSATALIRWPLHRSRLP